MLRKSMMAMVCLLAAGTSAWPLTMRPQLRRNLPLQSRWSARWRSRRRAIFWTYEVRDEISGKVSAVRKNFVTEVTPTEISVRVTRPKARIGRGPERL